MDRENRTWLLCTLGRVDYSEALDLQRRLVGSRTEGRLSRDVVLMLDHPPVFTLGRRGGRENLVVSEAFLEERGVPIVQVERGGNITFHGPGQLIVYPIVDLEGFRISVTEFVDRLEEIMIRVAADWKIGTRRDERNRGIWVGPNKMGSIGIHIRKGVTFHGLALNVNTDLTPFGWINPCGLEGVGMTSMELESGGKVPMDEVCNSLSRHLSDVFNVGLQPIPRPELENWQ